MVREKHLKIQKICLDNGVHYSVVIIFIDEKKTSILKKIKKGTTLALDPSLVFF